MTKKGWVALSAAAAVMPLLLCVSAVVALTSAIAADQDDQNRQTAYTAGTAQGVPASVKGIPQVMLSAYTNAASRITTLRPNCTGMRWSVLAGIGKAESNHAAGRHIAGNGAITPRIIGARLNGTGAGGNTSSFTDTDNGTWDSDTAYDRAVGPMQFLPSTWDGPTGQDGNNDGVKDPHNAFDAALGTAVYLCGNGHSDLSDDTQLRKAVLRYNHASWYADEVLQNVHQYDQLAAVLGNTGSNGPVPVAVSLPGPPAAYQGGATACSYPDPTGGRCLTGATAHGYTEILKKWPHWHGGIGCQTPRAEGGEHPLGRACDYTAGTLGTRASGSALAQGWALAAWLRKNADALHVQYVIWQGRIWSINHPEDQSGWGRLYDHGLNNPHTITGGHYDHVHVTYKD
ncbi:lytic transglycosylase domain-containing protein [Streptomyces sp. NPDC048297]|uniref:lytic transglycosylase domain-containing protein n=1 Tax=Streptomyces sp. NPDC048297 TaxID=3365531 RepID=UPI003714A8EF